jgi:hypothetical protein
MASPWLGIPDLAADRNLSATWQPMFGFIHSKAVPSQRRQDLGGIMKLEALDTTLNPEKC